MSCSLDEKTWKNMLCLRSLGLSGLGGGACGSSLQGDLCPLANLDMVREKQRDANCQLKGKKTHHGTSYQSCTCRMTNYIIVDVKFGLANTGWFLGTPPRAVRIYENIILNGTPAIKQPMVLLSNTIQYPNINLWFLYYVELCRHISSHDVISSCELEHVGTIKTTSNSSETYETWWQTWGVSLAERLMPNRFTDQLLLALDESRQVHSVQSGLSIFEHAIRPTRDGWTMVNW